MEGKTEWPQSLKDFANRVFASCTDSNRKIVSEELRSVIFNAFQAGTIDTTDWSTMKLKTLGGGPGGSGSAGASGSSNGGGMSKKAKKRALNGQTAASSSASGSSSLAEGGFDDQDKKEKRARRFERDQRAHMEEQERGWSDAIGSTSLASRFGATALVDSRASSSSDGDGPGWAFDNTPSSMPGPSRLGGGGRAWNTPPAAGGFDDSIADPNVIDWDRDTVVGLSTKLEKPYLRLTSAPDPRTVRPLPILEQTLELLKKKWRSENNYAYICDQFKSMRQDLTVQRIKNDFTVKVYEIHARIALEKGDLGEYNQCQSQLRGLYAYGLKGAQMEFLAYRILYLLHTRNRREVNALMSELTPASKSTPAVHHALSVRLALATANYHSFFKLYLDAPNMNAYIMDHFVERERVAALGILAKAQRPSLPLAYIQAELGFADLEEAEAFLRENHIDTWVELTPAEAQAATAAASSSGKKKKGKGHAPPAVPLEERKWDCKNALPGVMAAGEKYRKVDIKGQI